MSPSATSGDYGERLGPGARSPAPYAAAVATGRRLLAEPPCATRSDFQRDRDRVLHSTAFRRLTHKTQVFVYHEGDHYRTRLTHTLEVAQIARTIARQLRLDEDLAEALALAHDLGHPPFGHAGERALDRALAPAGGFDHNVQSARVVLVLERRYVDFDGLNPSWATLEGLAKHNGPPAGSGRPGHQAMVHALRHLPAHFDLRLDRMASAEAQVAAIADDVAWHTHDLDDGLRAGLLDFAELAPLALIAPVLDEIDRRRRDAAGSATPSAARAMLDPGTRTYAVTRALITRLIADVIAQSRRRLAALAPASCDDIRGAPEAVIAFSPPMAVGIAELRRFLFARLYRNPRVTRVMDAAERIVADLIARYATAPHDLPPAWQDAARTADDRRRLRRIGDFVAGMTDRYAIAEHRRLFDDTPELR